MDQVLKEFAVLNQIPRPSGHEEKIAAYLGAQGKALGYQTVQDDFLNVIIEVPATEGYEDAPLVILQAHTDMVCVGGEGYDPLADPIITESKGNFMTAKGTSLGADDGIGVAMLLALMKGDAPHGPLRLLFTSDEEVGMEGAKALDSTYLEGQYLINVDWEDINTLCIGCASCGDGVFEKTMAQKPIVAQGYTLSVAGLRGGHSGCEIHENRGNAIKIIGDLLYALVVQEIPFHLLRLEGGKAMNVIAPEGTVAFGIAREDAKKAEETLYEVIKQKKAAFPDDKNLTVTLAKTADPAFGYCEEDSRDIAMFLHAFPQGVVEMSQEIEGFVSTSCNLGVISLAAEILTLVTTYRSDAVKQETALMARCRGLGEDCGMTITKELHGIPWTPQPHSFLEERAVEAYRELNLGDLEVVSVHAGLECAYFARKNPALQLISLGPTVEQCHSIEERLTLDSVPKAMAWLKTLLKKIK